MSNDLTRRGYNNETRRHRDNLTQALAEVRLAVGALDGRLYSGENELAGDARRLLANAGDVAQAAAALDAASQLSFLLDEDA